MLGVLEIRVSFTNNCNKELRVIDKINLGIKEGLNIAVNEFLEEVKCNNDSKERKHEQETCFRTFGKAKKGQNVKKTSTLSWPQCHVSATPECFVQYQ